MRVSFISSKDTGEICTIDVWSNNAKIMWGSGRDDIIRELFESFLYNYQKKSEIISGSEFKLMDYKLHKIRLRRGGSYKKSPEWLLYKRAITNPKNKMDDKCFQYSLTLELSYNEIKTKKFRKHT